MKKVFTMLIALFFLNGCAESIALLGSSVGGASSGKILQSSVHSVISYGVKHKTGKTPLGHALAYAEEKNPEKKKEKAIKIAKNYPKKIKIKDAAVKIENDLISSLFQIKKSPRKLAIDFQSKIKKSEKLRPQSVKLRP